MRGFFLDPGSLRHELSLQSLRTKSDGAGGYVENWVEVASIFAAIEPLSADSLFRADQRLEEATHRITMRNRDDVKSGMRFEKRGRVFVIRTVSDPDESGRYLICTTREDGR